MAPDKTEIKKKMLSNYQLKIADSCNIPVGTVEKLMPNFFDKEKYVFHCENAKLYLMFEAKKIHRVLEIEP